MFPLIILVIAMCFILAIIIHPPTTLLPTKLKVRTLIRGQVDSISIQNRKNELKSAIVNPPEIEHLKSLLEDLTADFHKWDCLIAIGDIYRKGAFPRFLPNNDLAIKCYKIAAMCPNGNLAGLSQGKYIEAMTQSIDVIDKDGVALPTKYGHMACELAFSRIKSIPLQMTERPKMMLQRAVELPELPELQQFPQFPQLHRLVDDYNEFIFDDPPITIVPVPVPEFAFSTDAQNVHDHAVMSIARTNLKVIKLHDLEKTSRNNAETLNTVHDIINANDELSSQQKSDALLVLTKLGNKKTSFGESEQDVLTTVMTKISNEKDDVIKQNLTETLGKQLASGVENGSVVCSTGKILRILGTLDGTDDMEQIRPIWALKEEIGTLAATIRDKHVSRLNYDEKEAYDRGELQDIEANMKKEYNESAEQIYFEKLNMSKAIVQPIIQMYEDAF